MTASLGGLVRVRFAPAPTGYLHLGGARTALFNWLYGRHTRGKFVLRIEDTDIERSTDDSTSQVLEALQWLGLDWDEGPGVGGDFGPYFQTQRREQHLVHARRLIEEGRAYECYMTPEELEVHRQVAIAAGKPFHYEGWHRNLTREQTAQFKTEGRRPAIRLLVNPPAEGYTVDDLIKGPTHFPADQIDDFVLVRSDGTPSFHLANVVDDATMKITHVIRGEDHLTNTVRHQVLFQALGYQPPLYGHLPMILGPDRSKLSKRHGAVSVMEYAKMGYLPDAMLNELALLGWSPADGKEELTREELIDRFGLDRCGKAPSIFDFGKLDHFNRLQIKSLSTEELARKIDPFVPPGLKPEASNPVLIELVRDELVRLSDYAQSAKRILEEPVYTPETMADEAMKDAARVLQRMLMILGSIPDPWSREAIKGAIQAAGKDLGVRGKFLFMPIRVALTGHVHGPALDGTLTVLGREKAIARIRGFLEILGDR